MSSPIALTADLKLSLIKLKCGVQHLSMHGKLAAYTGNEAVAN
jgi:hypothetical protein